MRRWHGKALIAPFLFGISVLVLLLASATPVSAQYRGSFQGTITDPQGQVVPDATVTVTSQETNVSKSATTSSAGVYSITGLAPGRYTMTVEKPGFSKKVMSDVQLTSEQAQSQDVALEVGQTAQTVTVSAAEAPAIQTETGTISGTLTGAEIQALPTFGRDPFRVAQLAPGTFGDNARSTSGSGTQNLPGNAGPGGTSATASIFQTENQVQVVSNGTRNNSNSFQIDGVEVNSLAWGGAAVITPNEESVKEVTLQANPYSAENGRNSGAQVLVVSKSGTNEFHGSAVFKADRPGLNAYQRYNGPHNPVQRDTDRFNQWAGSLGGPVIRNHLFFFFSYETLINSSFSTALNWYETPQYLAAVKAAQPNSNAAKLAGYPGEGVSFNQIVPKSCADAGIANPSLCRVVTDSSGKYLGLDVGSPLKASLGTPDPGYVSPGNFGAGGGLDGVPDVFYVQTVNPTDSRPQQYNGRMDFQATSKDLIAFTSYYVPNDTTNYNGPVRSANFWHSNRLNEAAALLWDHTISSSWLNEARFNVTRWHFNEISSNPQEPWGLPQLKLDNFSNVAITNQYLGAPGPGIFAQTTYNFRDTASTVRSNHSIKFGADLYWEQDTDTNAGAGRPTYYFRNLWDLANDAPYQEVGNFDPKTGQPSSATKYIRSAIYAGFVQDDFRVKPNLTLNLGLRWEYFQPIHEKYGNISNVVLGPGPDPLTGLKLKVGSQLYQGSKNNWSPQIGFAWRPNPNSERLVVRGGFGIGYNKEEEAITLNVRNNPPLISSFTLTGSNIFYEGAIPNNVHQFGGWPANSHAVLTFDPSTNLPTNGAAVTLNGFPSSLPTTYTYRYSLDTQYQLGTNWIASLGYQGSSSRHYARQNNLNFLYAPLNPRVQTLFFFTNDANASYNAFLAELQHRFAQWFQMDVQYTWAHTIDDGSNDYNIGEYPYGLQYLKGDADYDVRHNFKTFGVFSPHIFKGGDWKEKIFGGWQISGILNYHTGFPWTPIYNNTGGNVIYQNSGYRNLRPGAYLGRAGNDSSNSTFEQGPNGNFPNGALAYFTVPAFTPGPAFPGTTGPPPAPSVGRNILRGPNYFDTDFTLQKSFGIPKMKIFGENARFEFRADFYNIFNKINLTPIAPASSSTIISTNGTTSNPLFGQPQSALGARVVELQARFNF